MGALRISKRVAHSRQFDMVHISVIQQTLQESLNCPPRMWMSSGLSNATTSVGVPPGIASWIRILNSP
jgi:hypothetical protein